LMKYGVGTARRGWLQKKDVINTLPLEGFLASLRVKPHAKVGAKRKSA
jgi:DNA polymerase (family X)